jgi:hypothetical protein
MQGQLWGVKRDYSVTEQTPVFAGCSAGVAHRRRPAEGELCCAVQFDYSATALARAITSGGAA